MNIALIPSGDEAPAGARPSALVTRLRKSASSRRVVLKGLFVATMAATLVPLDWAASRRRARAAGPTTEYTSCAPANYNEQATNWWSGPAVCYGGWRRGPWPCAGGWHFEGSRYYSDEAYHSYRLASTCSGRNAWRWAYGGRTYRCSDAQTETVWNSGERYNALTIAMCGV